MASGTGFCGGLGPRGPAAPGSRRVGAGLAAAAGEQLLQGVSGGEKVCVSGRARQTRAFLLEVTVKNIWFNLMQETL